MTEPNLQPVNEELVLPPIYELPTKLDELPIENLDPGKGKDEISQFDKRYREVFTGVMFLGRLKKTAKIYGHSFDLETPAQLMRLEAGVMHKEYINTLSAEQAWASLTVACYLRKVDNVQLPEPISADPRDTGLVEKYDWVLQNLSKDVIIRLFEECLTLDGEVQSLLAELESVGEAKG